MKNTFTFLLLISPFLLVAQSDYDIINVIPAPTSTTLDITNDGTFIYTISNNQIYKIDPTNGDIVDDFPISNLSGSNGISYGNGHLWIGSNQGIFRKIDPLTGDIVESVNHDIVNNTHGMQFLNQYIFANLPSSGGELDSIYLFDLDGNIQEKYPTGLSHTHGFTFDGVDYWLTANHIMGGVPVDANIYKLDNYTLEKIDTFDCPGQFYPNGITAFQNSLWIADNGTDSIYQIKINLDVAINNLEKNDISLFPNPVKEQLEIDLGKNYKEVEVRIFNLNGQILLSEKYENHTKLSLDTPFSSGIYFIEILSERKSLGINKLVKE